MHHLVDDMEWSVDIYDGFFAHPKFCASVDMSLLVLEIISFFCFLQILPFFTNLTINWHEDHRHKPSSVSWCSILHGCKLLHKALRFTKDGRRSFRPWCEPSTNRKFTTKSAYEFQSYGGQEIGQFRWEKIRKFAGPKRASLTLSQTAHDRLKNKALLWSKQILPSLVCDLCSGVWESTLHVVRDCTTARRIWRMLLPSNLLESFMTPYNLNDLIQVNLERRDK